MGDYPWMTDMGTFVINGAEHVMMADFVRSPGVYYSEVEDPASGRMLFSAKVIPNRGAWLEFETNNKDQLWVKVDRKRKIAATTLLRAVGYETNDEIAGLFGSVDIDPEHPFTANTLDKDLTKTPNEALIEVYRKTLRRATRPPVTTPASWSRACSSTSGATTWAGWAGTSKQLDGVSARMGRGSYRAEGAQDRGEDIAAIVGHLIECNRGLHPKDDIDHLGNRRIRANGELSIQNAFRIGLLRMERVVRERMTIQEIDKATPNALINIRPVVAAMKEFFGGSQLSQFMDQTNPLASRVQSAACRRWARAACRVSTPGSTSATSTTATTAGSARSRRPRARTSALSGRSRPTAGSTPTASSRRPTAGSSGPSPTTTRS